MRQSEQRVKPTQGYIMKFTEAILRSTEYILSENQNAVVFGLGVNYPNGADGTMGNLAAQFHGRIFDTPVSEAANTGLVLGAATNGLRPIIHHGRVEFALFAIDQIVTQAAKWNYMFGGNYPAPLVYRIAVGRQWGNGPQHTQTYYSLFGSAIGLKTVVPSTPKMAADLLYSAWHDDNPVAFLEPRWLYQTFDALDNYTPKIISLEKSNIVKQGTDCTLISFGDGILECIRAAEFLQSNNISVEIIDLVSLTTVDVKTLTQSVSKTKNVIFFEIGSPSFSVASNVVSRLTAVFHDLKINPSFLNARNTAVPTATSLTKNQYPTWVNIVNKIQNIFNLEITEIELDFNELNLSPKEEFKYE